MDQRPAPATDVAVMGGTQVRVRGLTKTYVAPGDGAAVIRALDGVDLDVPAASVTAIVGASGSGKSTLLHLIGGMDRPNAGTITCDDTELTTLSRGALVAYRRTVGFVFQSFALLPALTARDNVMLPVIPYQHGGSARHRADDLLDQVGLGGRGDSLPLQLSGGQRQRVAIARALMNQPRLLVADEPTGNFDSTTGGEIINLLLTIRADHGTTVILATHDEHLAGRCDATIPVSDGRIAG